MDRLGCRFHQATSLSILFRLFDESELRNIGAGPGKQFLFTHKTIEAFLGPFWTFGLYYLVDSAAIAGHLSHASPCIKYGPDAGRFPAA
jgi:hypothetical protein